MADVRSLLRDERASRRIDHVHATYSDSGKLLCAVCSLQIKTESLWEKHIKSPQHNARLEHLRAHPAPQPPTAQSKKRKAGESDDEGRKRVKAVPGGFVPEGFFDTAQEDEQEDDAQDEDTAPAPSIPDAPASQSIARAESPASDVDEDEWAAFEREMAAAQQAALPTISASATISAAPVSAEDLAAQAREEQSAQRTAREAEIEADTEDAALALQQEFDEMDEFDERVRRLREKREALRLATQSDTLPDAPAPAPVQNALLRDVRVQKDNQEEDDDNDDDDDDDFDDWTFGAR